MPWSGPWQSWVSLLSLVQKSGLYLFFIHSGHWAILDRHRLRDGRRRTRGRTGRASAVDPSGFLVKAAQVRSPRPLADR